MRHVPAPCYYSVMPEEREPPDPRLTHNFPVYRPPRRRRKDVIRWDPPDPVIAEAFPEEARRYSYPFPICGSAISVRRSGDAESEERNRTCQSRAGEGTAHLGFGPCVKHAGNTSVVRRKFAMEAGQQFIKRFKAEQILFGGDPDSINLTPPQALMEELRRSVAMVRFLQAQISTWDPAAGDLGSLPALTDETTKGQSAPTDAAEWLRLYREERQHMVRVAKMSIDAGVSMAMVQIEQQKGVLIAQAVRDILDSIGLTPSQAALVPKVVPEILSRFAVQADGFDPANATLQGVVVE